MGLKADGEDWEKIGSHWWEGIFDSSWFTGAFWKVLVWGSSVA